MTTLHDDKNMTFVEHLAELRTRLVYSLLIVIVGCAVGFVFSKHVVNFLLQPLQSIDIERKEKPIKIQVREDGSLAVQGPVDERFFENASAYRQLWYLPGSSLDGPPDHIFGNDLQKPVYLNPIDPIMLFIKASLIVGLVLSLPFLLHQIYLFVGPGMTPREKRVLRPILMLGAVLFPLGAGFAYYMLEMVLDFLLNFMPEMGEPQLEVFRLVNFELKMMLGFGVVFELPLVVMVLTLMGVVHPTQLRQWRPYAYVVISVLAMLLTPPDPFSMLVMMLPLYLLFELSLLLATPIARKRDQEYEELMGEPAAPASGAPVARETASEPDPESDEAPQTSSEQTDYWDEIWDQQDEDRDAPVPPDYEKGAPRIEPDDPEDPAPENDEVEPNDDRKD